MTDVTRILASIERGDSHAAEQLLPLVYDELRKLAAVRLAHEKPGQTLQPTALVHEAYLRLISSENSATRDLPIDAAPGPHAQGATFSSRGHFFAAAAEAMRRILVENARRKNRQKHGGEMTRCDDELDLIVDDSASDPVMILTVHEALDRLAERAPRKAELVKLRYFLGCTIDEAADLLGIAPATAEEDWTYARAWLRREWLRGQRENSPA